jgi:quercetin dioxygenase-like cupin family protein
MNADNTELVVAHTSSGAEELAKMIPKGRVVSAFNTVPSEVLFGVYEAKRKATGPSLVYCGDDESGKGTAAELIRDVGFHPMDAGPLRIPDTLSRSGCSSPNWRTRGKGVQNWRSGSNSLGNRQCTYKLSSEGIQKMDIKRSGSQASGKGPAEYFTGAARVDPLFEAQDPARARGSSVTFEPGARTAWHTHPLGQTLIVTVGCGLVQRWGGPIVEIRPGDVIWFPPGEKHWHGATPTTAMTHIAIQEHLDGKTVDWMEKVSDEQYRAAQ